MRYVRMSPRAVDTTLLEDATRRGEYEARREEGREACVKLSSSLPAPLIRNHTDHTEASNGTR